MVNLMMEIGTSVRYPEIIFYAICDDGKVFIFVYFFPNEESEGLKYPVFTLEFISKKPPIKGRKMSDI